MTYAVIRFGGRQFKVSEGDIIQLQRQQEAKTAVLLYSDGKNVEVGTPVLDGYEVELKKLEDKRDKKVRIGRFKSKSRYRKVKGHKQPLSVFSVEYVGLKGKKPEKKVEEKSVKKEVVEKKEKIKAVVEKKAVKKNVKKDVKKEEKPKVKKAPTRRGRPKAKKED